MHRVNRQFTEMHSDQRCQDIVIEMVRVRGDDDALVLEARMAFQILNDLGGQSLVNRSSRTCDISTDLCVARGKKMQLLPETLRGGSFKKPFTRLGIADDQQAAIFPRHARGGVKQTPLEEREKGESQKRTRENRATRGHRATETRHQVNRESREQKGRETGDQMLARVA